MLLAALAFVAMTLTTPPNALKEFVNRPQSVFTWAPAGGTGLEFRMTSQVWQGRSWHHDILLQHPKGGGSRSDVVFLIVTGDRVDRVDMPFGQSLADASGLTVATLFDVPNQPLYDLREDDLIAYTFQQYLQTEDPDWPLLFPMVNGVVRAMDVIQQETKGKISRFIITGESKRGWTTWLVGTLADHRVIGIAPVAFDNLDFDKQLKHQFESWGKLSENLGSYTGTGLIEAMETPGGAKLRELVDPIFDISSVHVPVLSIRGANDPYWAADAAELYWPKVRPPKAFLVLPNEGHDFMSDKDYVKALADFPREIRHPHLLDVESAFEKEAFRCKWDAPVESLQLWRADSATKDFSNAVWRLEKETSLKKDARTATLPVSKPQSGFSAYFVRFVRASGDLTGTVHIVSH
jgi:PhoPQ-activated pathogenicity-related protein